MTPPPSDPGDTPLHMPDVTLCAVSCVNIEATFKAMEASMRNIRFGACKLLTDVPVVSSNPAIEIVSIAPLRSSQDYSAFVLQQLPDHVSTSHCLIVQWDGHVLDARRWRPEFLEYDYIGAPWPQFGDGHDVGNGGFSLRSRRLMEACRAPGFHTMHPEDVAICRRNRSWLEARGMRFAGSDLAGRFATERSGNLNLSFGYHGVFNMPKAVGQADFWKIYLSLDDRKTVYHDFAIIVRDILPARGGVPRAALMAAHMAWDFAARLSARILLR